MTHPACMAPDGAQPCEAYTGLRAALEEVERRCSRGAGNTEMTRNQFRDALATMREFVVASLANN